MLTWSSCDSFALKFVRDSPSLTPYWYENGFGGNFLSKTGLEQAAANTHIITIYGKRNCIKFIIFKSNGYLISFIGFLLKGATTVIMIEIPEWIRW